MVLHKTHREKLGATLRKAPDAITVADVRKNLAVFRCKKCNAHKAKVWEEPRRPDQVRYVGIGDDTKAHLVFHRDTCGWVGHIHKAGIIELESRDNAVMHGYSPCRNCKP
jgi:hypothetical protein